VIYLIGSMRNTQIPIIAAKLRAEGHEVFDEWYAPGPEADDYWQTYAKAKGQTMADALDSPHAWSVFRFDKLYLDRAKTVVLVMPAGKSAHLELGYSIGMGKRGFVYFDKEPERWDVMYRFANAICLGYDSLRDAINYTK
jgi:hypothetical protein